MKTQTTKKIIVSVLTALLLVTVVLTTIAVVYAALKQTITTNLNITYKAVNINGTVQAKYKYGSKEGYLTTATGEDVIRFNASDNDLKGSLQLPQEQIELADTTEIELTYIFTNSGDAVYSALMNFEGSDFSVNNMNVQYSLDGTSYSNNQYALIVRNSDTDATEYYVKVSVKDLAYDASFTGTITWLLENYVPDGDEKYQTISTAYSYTASASGYSVSYNGEELEDGKMIIPSKIGSAKVTSIAANTSLTTEQKAAITELYIPATVTYISANAFADLPNLQTVVFEEGCQITKIDKKAFANCTSLTSITIPASVTSINYGFYGCTNLQSVTFEEGSQLKNIDVYSFYKCSSLTSITIPASVTTIGGQSFQSCTNLQSVTFEEGSKLNKIASGAFSYCSSLSSITIPASVKEIYCTAFRRCTSLEYMHFENVTGWYSKYSPGISVDGSDNSITTNYTEEYMSDPTKPAAWFKAAPDYYYGSWYRN